MTDTIADTMVEIESYIADVAEMMGMTVDQVMDDQVLIDLAFSAMLAK